MAESETQQAPDAAQDAASSNGPSSNGPDGLFSELKETARDAALAVLKPAVSSAAKSAAGYAVSKGPDLVKDRVGPKLDDAGGLQGLADKALSNAGPAGKVASKLGMGGKLVDSITGGDDGGEADADATGSGRRMPVQQSMDVAVPLEVAYNQWTQFEEYPDFMHRVDSASQEDDAHVTFTEKIWGFSRDFEAEIVEQRPNERIVWRSVNGLKHAGVVTFHELAPRLTRIEVTVDFKPESLFQKFARGTRFSKRAIRADMHRFKAYVEMSEEEDGAWRGRIEDGEVVESSEDAEQREEEESPEASGAEDEEAAAEDESAEDEEAEEDEQPSAEAGDEDEEVEDEEEPEEAPRRRRSAPSGNGRSASRRSVGSRRRRPTPPRRRQAAKAR